MPDQLGLGELEHPGGQRHVSAILQANGSLLLDHRLRPAASALRRLQGQRYGLARQCGGHVLDRLRCRQRPPNGDEAGDIAPPVDALDRVEVCSLDVRPGLLEQWFEFLVRDQQRATARGQFADSLEQALPLVGDTFFLCGAPLSGLQM